MIVLPTFAGLLELLRLKSKFCTLAWDPFANSPGAAACTVTFTGGLGRPLMLTTTVAGPALVSHGIWKLTCVELA